VAIINIQLEKTQISARTPGHWRNRKVVESCCLPSRVACIFFSTVTYGKV